jgi:hypothetical protein
VGSESVDEEHGDVGVKVICFVKSNALLGERYGERLG